MRLFVAIELDRALKRALFQAAQRLPFVGRELRVVDERQIHLTLRFVGETADDRIQEVIAAVAEAVRDEPPFSFQVRGLGCFPKPGVAKVVWAGIEDAVHLERVARRVEAGLRRRGFPPEGKGWSGHITLARARSRPVRLELDPENPRFGEQEVEEIAVMESVLSPGGSTYVKIAGLALEEPGTPAGGGDLPGESDPGSP